MPIYVATLRAIFEADDDVSAQLIAETIRENGEHDLNDADDSHDELFVTQVTSVRNDISPEETITLFKLTRNALIRTRIKECFEQAKEFDKIIYVLEHRDDQAFDLANYDYTRVYDIAESILERNENPVI